MKSGLSEEKQSALDSTLTQEKFILKNAEDVFLCKGIKRSIDIVLVSVLNDLAENPDELKRILQKWSQEKIILQFSPDTFIESCCLLQILESYRSMIFSNQQRLQMEGIKKAVEQKKAGKGKYGRPKVQLPSDFETKVIEAINSGKSLLNYQRSIGLSKSTFYKYANKVIEKYKLRVNY